jgi:C1A family cysteine protease
MFSKTFLLSALALVSTTLAKTTQERFSEWVEYHEIKFINDAHEYGTFANWVDNDKHIETINARNMTYTLGHNQFSGMTIGEFKDYLGFSTRSMASSHLRGSETPCSVSEDGCTKQLIEDLALPESIDWEKSGAVTPVKNQGQCGSCWSFSTTGALEGAYFIKEGDLISFSEQQLVSCDNRQDHGKDMGCNGGLMDNAFSWIHHNGGLCAENAYPYTSGTTKTAGSCITGCTNVIDSDVQSYVDVEQKSDNAMMTALSKQPVSIAIQADQKDFQLYKSGVFDGDCGTQLDHGVLVVGYGTKDGADYYKVKNSWGETWGDKGYIYLGRGDNFNKGSGQCGMLLQPSYPVL